MKIQVCQPSEIPNSWEGQVLGFDIETEDLSVDSAIFAWRQYSIQRNRLKG